MVLAEECPQGLECLAIQGRGLLDAVHGVERRGQVVLHQRGLGAALAQPALVVLEGFPPEGLGLGIVSPVVADGGEDLQRLRDLAVGRAGLSLDPERLPSHGLGRLVIPHAMVDLGDGLQQEPPGLGLLGEVGVQLLEAALENLLGGELAPAGDLGVGEREEIGQEPGHPPGGLLRFDCPVSLSRHASGLHRLGDGEHQEQESDHRSRENSAPVAAHELAAPVSPRVLARPDGLAVQVASDVVDQELDRAVASLHLLAHRHQADVVEVAGQLAGQLLSSGPARNLARPGRGDVAEHALDLAVDGRLELQRDLAGQHLVEEDAEGIDVGARVDPARNHAGLLRAHVLRRSDQVALPRHEGPIALRGVRRLRDPEVDHLRHGQAVLDAHDHVGGLDVPVDDALAVSMLDALAHLEEQPESLEGGELVAAAVIGDGRSSNQLHDEVRPAMVVGSGIEDPGDVRVIHLGEGPPLGLESRDDAVGVQAALDELERDLALDGLRLSGQVHDPHPALTQGLEDLVGADALGVGRKELAHSRPGLGDQPALLQDRGGLGLVREEGLDLGPKLGVPGALEVQSLLALRTGQVPDRQEDLLHFQIAVPVSGTRHEASSRPSHIRAMAQSPSTVRLETSST